MDDAFKIYIERLRDGRTEEIREDHSPEFIDTVEKELQFTHNVNFEGQAYLADDQLIVHLNIQTYATLPCSICNEPVEVKIDIPNFYHLETEEGLKSGIYDFSQVLREAILLEVPCFAECNGQCPEREKIAKFLKVKSANSNSNLADDDDEGYQPFADIDLDKYKPTT